MTPILYWLQSVPGGIISPELWSVPSVSQACSCGQRRTLEWLKFLRLFAITYAINVHAIIPAMYSQPIASKMTPCTAALPAHSYTSELAVDPPAPVKSAKTIAPTEPIAWLKPREGPRARPTQLACFLTRKTCPIITVCCLKLLHFGVICYTEKGN